MRVILAAAMLAAVVPGVATPNKLVAQADAAPTPQLAWAPCTEEGLERYECAVADVPLDYAKPQGSKLGLVVLRQRATSPGNRIGTLFTAVGGPGGSGLDAAKRGLPGGELAARFDIVAFDQRGIGRSGQVHCFPSVAEQEEFWSALPQPPASPAEEREMTRASRTLAAKCSPQSQHLTTVDAARDLDLLRRAVGDSKLTYTGGSYASYLGEVYGALFGDRVRALQLNAMIDPTAYTHDAIGMMWERAAGTEEVFQEFAGHCVAPKCSFAGPDILGRNSRLLDRLRSGPITVDSGSAAIQVRYQDIVPVHANLLYDTQVGWPALADLLSEMEQGPAGSAQVVTEILEATRIRLDFLDSFIAISCVDIGVPRAPGVWPALAPAFDAHVPHYGRHWFYLAQPCAAWQTPPQRYTGSWKLRSATSALLINNRFDPVTPLSGARKAQHQLGNAELVIVEGHGHDITGSCTDRLRSRYLIDLQLPAPGTTCQPDRPPFGT
ncbi:MAG: alpha/beta hydrolase [Kibdelosporangium sp.]